MFAALRTTLQLVCRSVQPYFFTTAGLRRSEAYARIHASSYKQVGVQLRCCGCSAAGPVAILKKDHAEVVPLCA